MLDTLPPPTTKNHPKYATDTISYIIIINTILNIIECLGTQ